MKKLLLSLVALICVTFGYAQTNLLQNGGFENWADGRPTGWMTPTSSNPVGNGTISQSTSARSGSSAVLLTNSTAGKSSTSNQRLATDPMSLKAGKYTYTVYTKAVSGQAAARIGYVPVTDNGDGTYKAGSYSWGYNQNKFNGPDTISNEWFKQTYTFELKADGLVCLLVMHSRNIVEAEILVDDATLVKEDGEGEGEGGVTVPHITIADFLAKKDTNTEYELTGKVTEIANTTYGNLYIEEDGTKLYIYGLLDKAGQSKNFASLGIAVGDILTVTGKYYEYKETPQIQNAQFVKVEKGDAPQLKDPTNTEETAYTVSQAIEIIKSSEYDLTKQVYVKGIVVSTESFNSSYGSISYWISDDGSTANRFEIYGGLNFGGSKFDSQDDLEDGDEVIVKGLIKAFTSNGTTIYEMDKNNVLVKLNGSAPSTDVVATPAANLKAGSYLVDEVLTITLTCATEGADIYYSIDDAAAVKGAVATIPAGEHTLVAYGQSAAGSQSETKLTVSYNVVVASALNTELTNCDLESWTEGQPDGWTSISTSSNAKLDEAEGRNGKGAKIIGTKNANARLGSREMKLAAGSYVFSAYVKDATAGDTPAMAVLGYVPLAVKDGASNYTVGEYSYPKDGKSTVYTTLSSTEWTKLSYEFTLEQESIVSFVVMNHYPKKDEVWCDIIVDDIQLEKVGETAISAVQASQKAGAIYDLSGRRVEKATKGIYVIGGKKVIK